MEIAGYQSDIKTTNVFNEDTYTAEKSIAEFGVTTGTKVNTYALSLTPKLSKPYEKGLRLQVQFHKSNTGPVTLNVDGKGAVPVVRFTPICDDENDTDEEFDSGLARRPVLSREAAKSEVGESRELKMETLVEGNINTQIHYILVFDGEVFQMVNHIPECVSKSDVIIPPPQNELFFNRQELLTIQADHVDPRITVNIGRNRYAAINGNLIVARDIRIKRTGGPGTLFGARIKLPKPLDPSQANSPGALQSLQGNTYYYGMDKNGVIQIQGELTQVNDEINVNFYPYIAKYPLEYDTDMDFSKIIVPPTPSLADRPSLKKPTKSRATTRKPKTK